MKKILLFTLLLISINLYSQNPLDNTINQKDSITPICGIDKTEYSDSIPIKINMLIKENHEINKSIIIYGEPQIIANYISIVSFTTVIGGTLLGVKTSQIVLVTGLCDLATLIITGRAARRLAHKNQIKN